MEVTDLNQALSKMQCDSLREGLGRLFPCPNVNRLRTLALTAVPLPYMCANCRAAVIEVQALAPTPLAL